MEREEIVAELFRIGIVPVVRTTNAESALRCIDAIHRGGIRAVEIPMTVPDAVRALEQAADRFGDEMILGAGTVLDGETTRTCVLAGARFIFSPCVRPETIEIGRRYSCAVMPGALTPTEVVAAWESGADAVRIVPCDAMGGIRYIRSLRAPFPHIEMVAVGGVTLENVGDYLRAGVRAVGVTGALIDSASLREGNYEVFVVRAARFLEAIRRAREILENASARA